MLYYNSGGGDWFMLNEKVKDLLNQQINKEFYSAYLYLAFSNYFADRNLARVCKLVPGSGAGRARPRYAVLAVCEEQQREGYAGSH